MQPGVAAIAAAAIATARATTLAPVSAMLRPGAACIAPVLASLSRVEDVILLDPPGFCGVSWPPCP